MDHTCGRDRRPFAPELLRDYDLFCRKHGHIPYSDYLACWRAATSLIEAAEEEGADPFALTPDDLFAFLGYPDPN